MFFTSELVGKDVAIGKDHPVGLKRAPPRQLEPDLLGEEQETYVLGLRYMIRGLQAKPETESAAAALRGATELLEHAAYSLARTPDSQLVTYLFLIAAELERKADYIDRTM